LIEVLTGKKLSEAVAERVLQPLGMVDTGFQVPAAKSRAPRSPGPRPNGQPMTPRFKVDDGAKYESGGGGMTSTMEDYLRFTMALANGGAFQGKRIIGKQTLDFMTADHTGTRPGRPRAWDSASASRSVSGSATRRSRARSANMAGPAMPAPCSGSTPRNSSSQFTWCR
jgi:CubicO group peptidase (beta-lactamase class C family)